MEAKELLEVLADSAETQLRTQIADYFEEIGEDLETGVSANLAKLARLAAMEGDEARLKRVADGTRAHLANMNRDTQDEVVSFIEAAAVNALGLVAMGARHVAGEVRS
ncbi:hypothetical protein [Engelhardtia mirabilis]|uniref:Uncharacterized protein n=1 Tax=Engelhardtia mirabilis TaxID=2528011 RepID=A0A518BL52_9BACT|nr:hypothetical protein Pla133_27850 [Planctomycetes bacterium Pla133]QDV02023.1 hypothetical protein Pla86_27840 [Planctomycetes bacterium Pla86]